MSRQEDKAIGRVIAANDQETEANAQIKSLEIATEADGPPDVKRKRRGLLAAAYAHEGRTLTRLRAANLALLRVIRTDAATPAARPAVDADPGD